MRLALRIFHNDLFLLLQGIRGLLLVLVLPPLMLLLVGDFSTGMPSIRLLVAGVSSKQLATEEGLREAIQRLNEISGLEVEKQEDVALDPLSRLQAGGFDLLLNLEDPTSHKPVLYTAVTDPSRLFLLEQIAAGIEPALSALGKGDWQEGLLSLGAAPGGALFEYYPSAGNRFFRLIPFTIAMIVCFLPFVLASPSLLQEKESHTLEVLLTAPGAGLAQLLAGKCLMPVVVTLANFALMLAIAQSLYDLPVKAGLPGFLAFLVPVLLSSTFLGLTLSCVAGSQAQVTVASAVYLVALFLLSGQFFQGSSSVLQSLSRLLPLTFLRTALNSWSFGAGLGPTLPQALSWLSLQVVLYGVLCFWTFRRLRLSL